MSSQTGLLPPPKSNAVQKRQLMLNFQSPLIVAQKDDSKFGPLVENSHRVVQQLMESTKVTSPNSGLIKINETQNSLVGKSVMNKKIQE